MLAKVTVLLGLLTMLVVLFGGLRVMVSAWREWRSGRRWLVLLAILLLPSTIEAATYYVSTTGNDTTGTGTIGSPWRTIAKGETTAIAGDTVNVRGGTYSEYLTFNANGTAGSRITFQSYPGETAIINGSGTAAPNSNAWLVRVEGDYITIKDFEIVNAAWMSVICWNTATGCIIDGNTVHHGYHAGIVFYQNTNNIAQNNTVYDMYDFNSGGGNGDCMDTSGNLTTSNHQYLNNIVHDCSDDGIDGWSSTGNTYKGNISYHNGYIPFTSTPSGNGNGYKLGGNGGGGHLVIDNVAWGNRVRGFEDNTGANNRLYNNTSINNGSVNYNFVVSGAILANNISFGSLGSVSGTLTTNSWQLGISNPLFVQITDPTLNTFARLQSGSPAINVGSTVSGNTHTCIGVCDLGAFEFASAADTTPPAAPTGLQIISVALTVLGFAWQGRHLLLRGTMACAAMAVAASQMFPLYVARTHYEVKQQTAKVLYLVVDRMKDKV